ncbi:GPI alpha-1,2-mannosyltransferase 3-like [Babylonia areolata]|uniref:GPI alpha-1,2-mannosyltransferase 3-like n=1 Tax=Babylonia areolata TaxID=304850 RepID=UPI003FD49C28
MTKNNKSTAMIRRRKSKPPAEFLSRVGKSQPLRATQHSSNKNEDAFFHKQVLGSSVIAKIMASDKTIFLGLVVIRLVNALLIQTFFVPDEFWQSMEVAHNMVFDYGYLTWEWRVGIRSYAYPLLLASLYKLLAVLGLDYRGLLIRGPRLLQGVVASVGDMYLYWLSGRLAGREVAQWTLLCQLLSWFTAYCCTRTLSNGVETTLVTAALYYFPWPGATQSGRDVRWFVALAAMSVVVRPTAAVLWVLLAAWHLQRCKGTALWSVLRLYITTGLTVVGVSTVIDRVWYGRWILVHLNFLHFNVVSGGSGFYGRHPWHWYLTQGVPVTLGPHLLPFLLGACRSQQPALLLLILWQVFVLSLLAHKEFRFLLPLLPLAMHYCGLYFHSISQPPAPLPSTHTAGEEGGQGGAGGEGRSEGGGQEAAQDGSGACVNQNLLADSDRSQVRGDRSQVEEDGSQVRGNGSQVEGDRSQVRGHQEPSEPRPDTAQGPGSSPLCEKAAGGGDAASSHDAAAAVVGGAAGGGGRGGGGGRIKGEHHQRAQRVQCAVVVLAVSNLLPLLYFSLIHQRGTLDVMNFLHHATATSRQSHQQGAPPPRMSVLFLMPCHSTPFYSHLHTNVSLTFLTCEPNLRHLPNYTDEADLFYQDPGGWLRRRYGGHAPGGSPDSPPPLPSHLVYFNSLKPNITDFLQQGGYTHCAQFFHTHFPEGRLGSHVMVSCR